MRIVGTETTQCGSLTRRGLRKRQVHAKYGRAATAVTASLRWHRAFREVHAKVLVSSSCEMSVAVALLLASTRLREAVAADWLAVLSKSFQRQTDASPRRFLIRLLCYARSAACASTLHIVGNKEAAVIRRLPGLVELFLMILGP